MSTTINCNGKLLDLSSPKIMAILNVTPDSFYDGGEYTRTVQALQKVEAMIKSGADIIDIGGMSTRPGAEVISSAVECQRILPVIEAVRGEFPDVLVSVDTVYGATVQEVAARGVHLINDVSAGQLDPEMLPSVADTRLPYILMHMQGLPTTMQQSPHYDDVLLEVSTYLRNRVQALRAMGIEDIMIDPGFGFGKTIDHNYTLLQGLKQMQWIGCPIVAGLSRKSMIYKTLEISNKEALAGTIALNMVALLHGASILRVHDVLPAKQQIKLYEHLIANNATD